MPKIKIFCMQKDEHDILNQWIIYHGNLFGLNNIHIVDNGSKRESLEILQFYQQQGLNLSKFDNYAAKGDHLCQLIKKYEEQCDIAIPLDLDEFIGCINLQQVPMSIKKDWVNKCQRFDKQFYCKKYPHYKHTDSTPFDYFIKTGFKHGHKTFEDNESNKILLNDDDVNYYISQHEHNAMRSLCQWAISCSKTDIFNVINNLIPYGRYSFQYYITSINDKLFYEDPVCDIVNFSLEDYSNHRNLGNYNKKFFLSSQLLKLDHGHHHGVVTNLSQNMVLPTKLCLFHFHYRGAYKLLEKAKNDMLGLGYVNDINNHKHLQKLIDDNTNGSHNIKTYLKFVKEGPSSLLSPIRGSLVINCLSQEIKRLLT